MSSQDIRKRHSIESPVGRIPKLPPIEQYRKSSDRFDKSPLLKYRRSNDVQDLLGNVVYANYFCRPSLVFVHHSYSVIS